MEEEQLMEKHIFGNPRILDSGGKPYKIMKELARVDIFRVRDLSFKPGRKNYNKKVLNSIKEIKKHPPVLSSQLSQENNLPINIILNKKRISIDRIKQKDIYIELKPFEKFNDIYKQKWESILNNTSLNWSVVWTNIYQTKISLDIKQPSTLRYTQDISASTFYSKEVQSKVLHISYVMKPSVNIAMKSCTAECCLRFWIISFP